MVLREVDDVVSDNNVLYGSLFVHFRSTKPLKRKKRTKFEAVLDACVNYRLIGSSDRRYKTILKQFNVHILSRDCEN